MSINDYLPFNTNGLNTFHCGGTQSSSEGFYSKPRIVSILTPSLDEKFSERSDFHLLLDHLDEYVHPEQSFSNSIDVELLDRNHDACRRWGDNGKRNDEYPELLGWCPIRPVTGNMMYTHLQEKGLLSTCVNLSFLQALLYGNNAIVIQKHDGKILVAWLSAVTCDDGLNYVACLDLCVTKTIRWMPLHSALGNVSNIIIK